MVEAGREVHIGAKSTSDNPNKDGGVNFNAFKRQNREKTKSIEPKVPHRENHGDQDKWETETRDSHFPPNETDFQAEMDENYSRLGSYHASHFQRNPLNEKGHVMTGFFKFLGCCGER